MLLLAIFVLLLGGLCACAAYLAWLDTLATCPLCGAKYNRTWNPDWKARREYGYVKCCPSCSGAD